MALPKTNKKILRAMMIVILLNLLIYAVIIWYKKDQGKDAVVLAYVGPVTRTYGRDIVNALEMYLEKANRAGGVHGRKILLRRYDDGNDPEAAVGVAEQIAREKNVLLVLGHSTSDTALAAAEVYDANGVPAITADATSGAVTTGNPWYFNVIPNNRMQADFIANYLYFTLGKPSAALVYVETAYGRSLANSFETTAGKLGLTLRGKWGIPSARDHQDRRIKEIVSDMGALGEAVPVVLAMEIEEGMALMPALRASGQNPLFVGTDAFSEESFLEAVGELPRERETPGAFSDGLLCTTPFMSNLAAEKAHGFSRAYSRAFGKRPTWSAACYYDAAHMAVEAIRRADAELNGRMGRDRKKVRDALTRFHDKDTAVEGITGLLYFDSDGNVNRPYAMGVYKKQRLLPAFTQYTPVGISRDREGLFQTVLSGEYTVVDRAFMNRFRVIYAEMILKQISHMDTRRGVCTLDLAYRLAFPVDLDPGTLAFTSSVAPLGLDTPVSEKTVGGVTSRLYRVSGEFRADFNGLRYPYDSLTVPVHLGHASETDDRLVHVSGLAGLFDAGDAAYTPDTPDTRDSAGAVSLPRGWRLHDISHSRNALFEADAITPPGVARDRRVKQLTRFSTHIHLRKSGWGNPGTFLLVLVVFGAAYAVYFLPEDRLRARLLVWAPLLLLTSACHLWIRAKSPFFCTPPGEYAVFVSYFLGLSFICLSITSYDCHRRGREKRRDVLRRAGRIGFPCFAAVLMILLLTPSMY